MDVKLESAGNSSEPLFKGMIKQATVAGISAGGAVKVFVRTAVPNSSFSFTWACCVSFLFQKE